MIGQGRCFSHASRKLCPSLCKLHFAETPSYSLHKIGPFPNLQSSSDATQENKHNSVSVNDDDDDDDDDDDVFGQ
jgi:hypothetical protein